MEEPKRKLALGLILMWAITRSFAGAAMHAHRLAVDQNSMQEDRSLNGSPSRAARVVQVPAILMGSSINKCRSKAADRNAFGKAPATVASHDIAQGS